MKHRMQRTSSLLFATLALSLSLQFAAPVWALDLQQAIAQQQLEPVYEWAQSASLAELRNAYVSWRQMISTDVYDSETGIWKTNNYFGGSLLHWAAHTGQNRLIELLLNKGLEPDLPVFDTGTPLMAAARSGQLESVRLLVARGAEPDQWAGPDTISPLKVAIQEGHVEVARWLAAQKPVQPLCEQAQGLFAASVMGERLEMVRYLQEQGCGLQDRSKEGYTPLMEAARRGHVPLFQMLLAQGHDPRIQASDGTTALMLAAQSGQSEIVETLLTAGLAVDATNKEGEDALQQALAYGHLPIVQALLARGASLKAKTPQGQAYLLASFYSGHLDVLRFVLSQGFAPTDLSAEQYQTVLLNAAYRGHTEMLKYLLAQGVRPDVRHEGMTPLLWAARLGHSEAVKLLLAAGVDPNEFGGQDALTVTEAREHLKDSKLGGYPPLMEAAVSGHFEIVQILLAAGADPLLKTADGDSALSLICQESAPPERVRLEIVQQLLLHGARIGEVNALGRSPLMYAAQAGDLELVKLLVSKGASLRIRDHEGQTVLDHVLLRSALLRNPLSVISFLLDQGARVQDLLPGTQLLLLAKLASKGDLKRISRLLDQQPTLAQNSGNLFLIATHFAEQGYQEGLQYVLKRGLSRDMSPEQYAFLLKYVAASGNVELTQWLLSQDAWRNAQEDGVEESLLSAAEHGHAEVVSLLLAQERDPTQMSLQKALALSRAASAGQAKLVKGLLEQGAEPDFTRLSPPIYALSPLEAAAGERHLAVTKALLVHAHSPAALFLALSAASASGNLPVIQALLDRGAPVEGEVEGQPFASWLVENGHLRVLKYIMEQRPHWDPA